MDDDAEDYADDYAEDYADNYADDYAGDVRVDGAIRLIEQMEMHFAHSLEARAAALDKLEILMYERDAGGLDATILGGLVSLQQLYETQIESTNRTALIAAHSNLAGAKRAAKEKTNAKQRVSADTHKHELERSEWQAEMAALRAQLELATAANESYKAAAQKSKTRRMAMNHEYRELQREMERQETAFESQKAQAVELKQQLNDAQQRQTEMRQQLKVLRRQVQHIQIVPQPPAANVEADAAERHEENVETSAPAAPHRLEEPNDQRAVSASGSEPEDQAERAPVAAPVERKRLPHPIRSTKASVCRQLAIRQKIDERKEAEDAARAKDITTRADPSRVPPPARRARH